MVFIVCIVVSCANCDFGTARERFLVEFDPLFPNCLLLFSVFDTQTVSVLLSIFPSTTHGAAGLW
jgi:hypothetical protein